MRYLALSLIVAAGCPASASDENKRREERVAQFAAAVNAGKPPSSLQFDPEPSESEKKALADLAGCVPSLATNSHSAWITLNWVCENRPEAERQTSLSFAADGAVSVWLNPIEASLSPNAYSGSTKELPSYRDVTRKFARAVRGGADPTLGGLIPLTPEQIARLSTLQGLDYRMTTGNSRRSQTMFWDIRARTLPRPPATDLLFNGEGRPIGLIVSTTSIAR